MPTITAFTAKRFSPERKNRLIEEVNRAIQASYDLPPEQKCFLLIETPEAYVNDTAKDEAFVIVWTGAGRTVAQRRKIVSSLTEAFRSAYDGFGRITISIKEHDEVNCGIDGVGKLDMHN